MKKQAPPVTLAEVQGTVEAYVESVFCKYENRGTVERLKQAIHRNRLLWRRLNTLLRRAGLR